MGKEDYKFFVDSFTKEGLPFGFSFADPNYVDQLEFAKNFGLCSNHML
jgi:hypothetical protein